MDDFGGQRSGLHLFHNGFQDFGRGQHPVAHRLAAQFDAVPPEYVLLAVQRQVVGVLADHDLRQQPRSRQALCDGLRRFGRDRHALLAARAGEHGLDVVDNEQRGRGVFELLRDLLTDAFLCRAALRAHLLGFRHGIFNGQVGKFDRRLLASVALLLRRGFGLGLKDFRLRRFRLNGRHRLGRKQQQLRRVYLLRAAAVHLTQQMLDPRKQPRLLQFLLAQR